MLHMHYQTQYNDIIMTDILNALCVSLIVRWAPRDKIGFRRKNHFGLIA